MRCNKKSFGQLLRKKRITKKLSLRNFAQLVGVSPTYLSQVEHGNADPPTAKRVKRMAEILSESPDEWIALAGRVPDDLTKIIQKRPIQILKLIRAASRLTAEELEVVTTQICQLKQKNNLSAHDRLAH